VPNRRVEPSDLRSLTRPPRVGHDEHIQVGWRWLFLDERLVLRASLSYLQCVAAKSSANLATARRTGTVEMRVDDELDEYLTPISRPMWRRLWSG
jgi:hypothetical protein